MRTRCRLRVASLDVQKRHTLFEIGRWPWLTRRFRLCYWPQPEQIYGLVSFKGDAAIYLMVTFDVDRGVGIWGAIRHTGGYGWFTGWLILFLIGWAGGAPLCTQALFCSLYLCIIWCRIDSQTPHEADKWENHEGQSWLGFFQVPLATESLCSDVSIGSFMAAKVDNQNTFSITWARTENFMRNSLTWMCLIRWSDRPGLTNCRANESTGAQSKRDRNSLY